MSSWKQIQVAFEWGRLKDFLQISRKRVVAYIGLSIAADFAIIIGPSLIILAVTQSGGIETSLFNGALAPYLKPEVVLPLAFVMILLSQAMIYGRIVLIRQLDRSYFRAASHRIFENYKRTDIYRREYGEHVRRIWFSKNISRNVRHTSEAMQTQLKMVPDIISLFITLFILGLTSIVTVLAIIPAIAIAGVLLAPVSIKIFQISKEHFTLTLPAFTVSLTSLLNKVYTTTSDFDGPKDLGGAFEGFLDSRYQLNLKRGYFAVYSSVIISGLLIAIIFTNVMYNLHLTEASTLQPDTLFIQVVLMLQIMNKCRALLATVGSISSLYPQIKILREIDDALLKGQELDGALEKDLSKTRLWEQLPFLIQCKGNSNITRFNASYLMDLIAAECLDEQQIPKSQYVAMNKRNMQAHFTHLSLESVPEELDLLTLINGWLKLDKHVFIVDWQILSQLTFEDIAYLAKQTPMFRLILASHVKMPTKWLKVLRQNYVQYDWKDPTEISEYGRSTVLDSIDEDLDDE